jgi:hypothetical protein
MIQGIDPFGVIAYQSSGKDKNHYEHGIYTGIYGQCVEYVRRWLLQMYGLTFESIPQAIDLIDVHYAYSIKTYRIVPFQTVLNGHGALPRIGSILVFSKTHEHPHGHVAVVIGIQNNRMYLSEQNYSTDKWERNYSRTIPIHDSYAMDPACIGWKTVLL